MTEAEPYPCDYLVVDDDEVFAETLARSLSLKNLSTQIANTPYQALKTNKKYQPARIILDLKLENHSGLHLIEQLKKDNPVTSIVILTGYSSINTAVEAIKLGADHYLCKPAGINDIISAFDEPAGDPDTEIAVQPPSVNRLEWEHIQRVLDDNDGNVSATARALGMHRRTLQRKLQKKPRRF
jgi:two-component system, response regulator RegA